MSEEQKRESYNLVIQSSNALNLIQGTNTSKLRYFINWTQLLPPNINKYAVTFSFMSQMQSGANNYTDAIDIMVNCGNCNTNIYEVPRGKSYKLGSLTNNVQQLNPTGSGAYSSFYKAAPCDNPEAIYYTPTDNFIQVELIYNVEVGNLEIDPSTYSVGNYTLILNFKPLE